MRSSSMNTPGGAARTARPLRRLHPVVGQRGRRGRQKCRRPELRGGVTALCIIDCELHGKPARKEQLRDSPCPPWAGCRIALSIICRCSVPSVLICQHLGSTVQRVAMVCNRTC